VKQVLYFDSSRRPYVAGAAVIACFDARFELSLRKLLRRLGIEQPDTIRVAGGARALVRGTSEERAFLVEQVRSSRRLHGSSAVLLVSHSDCGAYGGLCAFDGDAQRELTFQLEELRRAAHVLTSLVPDLPVQLFFCDFERVVSIAATDATSGGPQVAAWRASKATISPKCARGQGGNRSL
jgi:hypothetical protein